MQYPAMLARGSYSLAKYTRANPATVMLALDLVSDLDDLDLTDEQLFNIFEIKVARWKAVMNQLYDRFSTPYPMRGYYHLGEMQMIFKPTALIAVDWISYLNADREFQDPRLQGEEFELFDARVEALSVLPEDYEDL